VLSADKMSHAVTTECVQRKEAWIQNEHNGSNADSKAKRSISVVMPETFKGIPEEKPDEQDGHIKKVSVDVLKDQRKLLFSAIIFAAERRLAD